MVKSTKVNTGPKRNLCPHSLFVDYSFPQCHSMRSHMGPELMSSYWKHLGFGGFACLFLTAYYRGH